MEAACEPKTLQEAITYFGDPDNCLKYLAAKRWPKGVTCPACGSDKVIYLANQRRWKCRQAHARPQFSVKVGTVMEDSPIGLDKWLMAMWRIVNSKSGISSYEVHRAIGITQRSAWFLDHRIRFALGIKSAGKGGHVKADKRFIGGEGKTAVMGVPKRGGKVRTAFAPNRKRGAPGKRDAVRIEAERRAEFTALAEQWRRDTRHLSQIAKKIIHPAYFRIVGMGEPVVPLLLEELRARPAHWFAALRATANLDPSPADANPSQSREAWLEWGRSQGYIN